MPKTGSAVAFEWASLSAAPSNKAYVALAWLLFLFASASAQSSSQDDLAQQIAAAEAQPHNASLLERVGVAYARREDFQNAAEWFSKELAIEPDRMSARKNYATVLWYGGRRGDAEPIFRDLAQHIPTDPVPQLYLGLIAYDQGHFAEAADRFDVAGDLASANPETDFIAADAYFQSGHYGKASKLLESVTSRGGTPAQYRMLADAYDRQNEAQKAFAAYQSALKLDRTDDSLVALARFSIAHGNTEYARQVLTESMSRNPSSAKISFELGIVWALDGNFDKSLHHFDEAERLSPLWPLPLLAKGVALLQQGKAEEAITASRHALDVAPQDERVYSLFATALLRAGAKDNAVKRAEAAGALRRAIELAPQQARNYIMLAEIELSENEPQAALRNLETANRLDPGNASTLYALSQAHRRQGNTKKANATLALFKQAKARSQADENELIQILKTAQ